MEKILQVFADYYGKQGIALPEEAVQDRGGGVIEQDRGWIILFVFGAENEQEYLELYAMHRMSGDIRRRIYSSGDVVNLDALAPENSPKRNQEIASGLPLLFRQELKERGHPID
jgi:hypothetical protein